MDKTPRNDSACTHPVDSGLAALVLASRLLGVAADAADLRHRFATGQQPLDVNGLLRAARSLGLRAAARPVSAAGLDALPLPQLLRLRDGRWCVLARLSGQRALLHEGGENAPRILARPDFDSLLGDTVLLLRRSDALAAEVRFGARWLLRAALPYRGLFAEILLASAVLQLLGLATPLFFQVIVDKVLLHGALGTLGVLATGLAVVAVFDVLLGGLRGWLLSHTTQRIDVVLGARLFAHLTALPLRFFEARRVGDIVARVRELETLRAFFTGSALTVVIDLAFTVLAFLLMLHYSVTLTLVVACSLPLYLMISLLSLPVLRARLDAKFRCGADCQALLVESVSGIHTVKAMALEPQLQRRWEDRLAAYVAASFASAQAANWAAQGAQAINRLVLVAVLWFGAKAVIAGALTVGQLIAFNLFAQRMAAPVMRLFQLWQDFQQARIALRRLGDIMHTPREHAAGSARGTIGAVHGGIRFERVRFRYAPDRAPALADLDMEVQPGEMVGIVGASGSGKSTLARLLQRLHVPEQGRVLVDGSDIALIAPDTLRRQIGVVPQEIFLFDGTVRENIALADPGMPLEQVVAAARTAGAHDFICELPLGYDTPLGEQAQLLSGGQRQRLAIARALVRDPPVLVFDEATSALDLESELVVRRNLDALRAGRTVLMIAHRISSLAACDRIVVLDRGRIVEQGSPRELLATGGFYARLHALQGMARAA